MVKIVNYMDNLAYIAIMYYNPAMKKRAKFVFGKDVHHVGISPRVKPVAPLNEALEHYPGYNISIPLLNLE